MRTQLAFRSNGRVGYIESTTTRLYPYFGLESVGLEPRTCYHQPISKQGEAQDEEYKERIKADTAQQSSELHKRNLDMREMN